MSYSPPVVNRFYKKTCCFLILGQNQRMKERCGWANPKNQLYIDYHDHEWGVPVFDDQTLFEFIVLEGAQAGLSWETVLNKRDGYRKAFHGFDPEKVANITDSDLEVLRQNPAIIRNRLKIRSARQNARVFLDIQKECGSFSNYQWQFVDFKPIQNSWKTLKDVPANTPLSDTVSKDLKKRGMSFVGTTIIYSHMQATGMVNDHLTGCFRYQECAALSIK